MRADHYSQQATIKDPFIHHHNIQHQSSGTERPNTIMMDQPNNLSSNDMPDPSPFLPHSMQELVNNHDPSSASGNTEDNPTTAPSYWSGYQALPSSDTPQPPGALGTPDDHHSVQDFLDMCMEIHNASRPQPGNSFTLGSSDYESGSSLSNDTGEDSDSDMLLEDDEENQLPSSSSMDDSDGEPTPNINTSQVNHNYTTDDNTNNIVNGTAPAGSDTTASDMDTDDEQPAPRPDTLIPCLTQYCDLLNHPSGPHIGSMLPPPPEVMDSDYELDSDTLDDDPCNSQHGPSNASLGLGQLLEPRMQSNTWGAAVRRAKVARMKRESEYPAGALGPDFYGRE